MKISISEWSGKPRSAPAEVKTGRIAGTMSLVSTLSADRSSYSRSLNCPANWPEMYTMSMLGSWAEISPANLRARSPNGTTVTTAVPPVWVFHSSAAFFAGGPTVPPLHTWRVMPLKSAFGDSDGSADDGVADEGATDGAADDGAADGAAEPHAARNAALNGATVPALRICRRVSSRSRYCSAMSSR